uniref:Macrophage-expressed gene 1 protein n=1 Tax=Panagrolaimus superbus TaxID=310955 RepID=A0A914Z867_9BILA
MIFVSPTEISDVDKCVVALLEKRVPNKNSTKTLAGIVGLGWDDLRNVATIPVFATSFKKCSFVPDNDFLLPDNIVAVPVKDIALDKSSSTFDSFDDYMKESSDKISVSASGAFQGFSGSASFSNENQETKKEFFKSNSFMLQNKIVYKAYTLIANQHGRHDEYFTFRLNDIAAAIVAGKAEWVKYKSGKLIYDYGTHVVHKATVGASIEQQVFIETKEKFHGEGKMKAMKFEASAGMAGVFGVSGGYETKTNEQSSSSTKNSTTKTIIRTKGGPNINRLSNANTNASVLFMDNLVGMDKVGLYLYEIINVAKINYADDIKQKLEEAIKKATMDYYRFNTISGCTNVSAESFNFMANLNDGSCIAAKKYFGFGGIFQMCSSVYAWTITKESVPFVSLCDNIMLKNPVTKNFSCPSGYDPVLIHAYSVDFTNRTYQKEQQRCNWYSKLFNCAKTIVNETIHEKYYVKSYWCKNEIVIPPSPTTTVPSSEPKNNLDEIMDYKILTALQEEPGLLKMYFAGTYREIYNKTKVVLDPKPFQLFNTKNETETVYPDVLEITVSQIDKLANFPDVLRELIPRLKITKDSINKNTELQDQLVRNPILLKKACSRL